MDRPATIHYIAHRVRLTGIAMKDGGAIPRELEVRSNGPNLRLTDTGEAGTDYLYYVVGDHGNKHGLRTEDPQIHNIA